MSKKPTEAPDEELETRTAEPPEAELETVDTEPQPPVKGSPEWYNEKVPIRLFKDGDKYKEDVFVAVNGRGYLIQRGIEVMVPRFVAEVLYQSMDQDAFAAEQQAEQQAHFAAETRRLGIDN